MIKGKLYDKLVSAIYHKERKINPNPIKDWPLEVVSTQMGCNRGKPVDRYYIEKFLQEKKKYITGAVMEIGDNAYTMRYGLNVEKSYILTADAEYTNSKANVVVGDLQSGEGCEQEIADCFILTQTLPFIYDIQSAAGNIVKMLKNGGVALITVSGVSMLSEYDDSRWGHFWGFTETSLRRLFESIPNVKSVDIQSMGNPKTASAFIYGLSVEDLSRTDFEKDDKLIPLMISAVVQKWEDSKHASCCNGCLL